MAAAMQRAVHRPLRFHTGARGGVIQASKQRHQRGIAAIAFHRHCTLCWCRQPLRRLQAGDDAIAQAQPFQPGHGQHDGVVAAVVELGQTGVDVAAQVQQLQVRAQRTQLGLAAQ
ncbi:hypothetical protein D3C71_1514110 [compost metagenome]